MDSPVNHFVKIEKEYSWIIDKQFRESQNKLKIPFDPAEWTEAHVRHWLLWAVRTFNIAGVELSSWYGIDGPKLISMTKQLFKIKVPNDPDNLFWLHLSILIKWKIVAVVCKKSSADGITCKTVKEDILTECGGNSNDTTSLDCFVEDDRDICNSFGNGFGVWGGPVWKFFLELLTDVKYRELLHWTDNEGEFLLDQPEIVAQLWGIRRDRKMMTYDELCIGLRRYCESSRVMSMVNGENYAFRFLCDLRFLIGYSSQELKALLEES